MVLSMSDMCKLIKATQAPHIQRIKTPPFSKLVNQ